MLLVEGNGMYLVQGTATGGYEGTVGFWVMAPDGGPGNVVSADVQDVGGENGSFFPGNPDITWSAPAFIAALKAFFDGTTFGDGTTSITVTDPSVTYYEQSATDVTP
jgi:hypothetical protein